MVKINWDVAVNKNNGRISIGTTARDCEGVVLATCSRTNNIIVELVVTEALTAIHAMVFSQEMGFYDIILESDAL